MDKGTQEVRKREITWEEWHSSQRDNLSRSLGQLQALSTRPQDKEWDIAIIEWQKNLLETIIDPLWKNVRNLMDSFEKMKSTLEKRDNEITDILTKMQNWMTHYQPLLDKLKKEDDILRKVKEK